MSTVPNTVPPQPKGFIPEETRPDHWTLGSGIARKKLGAGLINDRADWSKWLPKKEIQKRGNLETMACTIFGTANCFETLANFHGFNDFPKDLAERYNGVLAQITPNGGSPHKACETFRLFGGLPEDLLPFSEDIRSWEYFYAPNPMDEDFVREGQNLLTKFVMGHEWVFNGNKTLAEKQHLLKQALKRGTVAVSVYAWSKEGDYYVKRGPDNHWLQLVGYKEGKYWIVNDHYEPTEKRLAWDTDFYCAKLYFLSRNKTGIPPHWFEYAVWLVSKGRVQEALAVLLKRLMPVTPPEPPVKPRETSEFGNEHLYNVSKANLGRDVTPKDEVPDEVACVVSFQAVFNEAFGFFIGAGPARYNTRALKDAMKADVRFKAVQPSEAKPGDIALCPTGEGVGLGHVWIVGKRDWMSNTSKTGLWQANYTKQQIINDFVKKRRFPLYVFRYQV